MVPAAVVETKTLSPTCPGPSSWTPEHLPSMAGIAPIYTWRQSLGAPKELWPRNRSRIPYDMWTWGRKCGLVGTGASVFTLHDDRWRGSLAAHLEPIFSPLRRAPGDVSAHGRTRATLNAPPSKVYLPLRVPTAPGPLCCQMVPHGMSYRP